MIAFATRRSQHASSLVSDGRGLVLGHTSSAGATPLLMSKRRVCIPQPRRAMPAVPASS